MQKNFVRKILNKPRFTIQIGSQLTLFQKKAWNVLTYNALKNPNTNRVFQINIEEFAEILGVTITNKEQIQNYLYDLVSTVIEWEVFKEDQKRSKSWTVTTLLSQAIIEKGVITYEYSSALIDLISNPEIYAKVDLLTQKRFTSKHSLSLWELCLDYVGIKQTPWIEIEQFCKYMSSPNYSDWRNIRRILLEPSIEEINNLTSFSISYETKKTGRKNTHIKILINTEANSVQEVAEIESRPRQLSPEVLAAEKALDEEMDRQVKEMKSDPERYEKNQNYAKNILYKLKFPVKNNPSENEE